MKSEIKLEREHFLDAESLVNRIAALAAEMSQTFHLEYGHNPESPEGYSSTLEFRSTSGLTKGLTGTLHLAPNRVLMVVNLPFALQPMAAKIESEINEYMDRNLGLGHGTQG